MFLKGDTSLETIARMKENVPGFHLMQPPQKLSLKEYSRSLALLASYPIFVI